jgi:transcriptional regulator with XRE-family HTH domain
MASLDALWMQTTVAIGKDERAFFAQLGARVAELRKAQNITQVQLAETLGVSQQTVNAYEMGHRRIPVSSLPLLAETLAVSLEELIGTARPAAKKRGPAPKLQQQIERIQRLPKAQQRFVMQMLDTVLQQASR